MASVYPRKWKTPSGDVSVAYQVQYFVNGKKGRKQFPTKRQAERFRETVSDRRQEALGRPRTATKLSLADWCQEWLATREQGSDGLPPLEPETVVWYQGLIGNHIAPALGRVPLAKLTRQHVKGFRGDLLSEGAISRRTVKKILVCLSTILKAAVLAEHLPSSPADHVGVRLSSRDRPDIEIHSPQEMKAILECAARLASSPRPREARVWSRYHPMLLILVYGGLRISEVRGLDKKDVDLSRMVVRVRQRADRRGRLGSPKSAKGFREVHLPKITEAPLRAAIDHSTHALVFHTASGRPIDCANFRKRGWEDIQKRAGVRKLTLHSCRHFYASRQIVNGVHPKELSELLGHSDEGFTLRTYAHMFKDRDTDERRRRHAEASVLTD